MNLEDLIQKFKNTKLGNPDCAVPVHSIDQHILDNLVKSVLSNYDLDDEKYATKEHVFYDTRRIVARNQYNKETHQIYSKLDFDDTLQRIISPVILEIEKILPNSTPVLIQLATILPGQSLRWHIDVFLYQQFTNKLHIPLITNEDSFFDAFVNDDYVKRVNMKTGNIYNIDNLSLHRSINNGSTIRTHLIIDVMNKDTLDSLLETDIDFFHTKIPRMSEVEKISLEKLALKYKK